MIVIARNQYVRFTLKHVGNRFEFRTFYFKSTAGFLRPFLTHTQINVCVYNKDNNVYDTKRAYITSKL